ncbi:MAG: hypothetical protein IVW52_00730 [Acidimicrobiales bacterium]|nr:hypothetical protein [Acidimicrobiales bacterium]
MERTRGSRRPGTSGRSGHGGTAHRPAAVAPASRVVSVVGGAAKWGCL